MSVTRANLVALFPEFSSTADYPDATVTAWLGYGEKMTDACAWGDCYVLGVCLYAAHLLVLGRKNMASAAAGGAPGGATGALTSKAVDKVSAGYDVSVAAIEGAGDWNLTTYGIQRARLMRLFGAGGVQL